MLQNDGKSLGVAERNGEAYQVNIVGKVETGTNDKIKLDNVLFLQSATDESTDEQPIQALRNAEVLAELWENCMQKQILATSLLPTWLEDVNGVKVIVKEDSQKSLMSVLEVFVS